MARICNLVAALGFFAFALVGVPGAAQAEKRIALVIGNAGYQAGALATPANDAGLIAQTLQAAGFDVVGARDLDQDTLRHAFRDFVEKATASGSDTVAFIYASGYGVQLEGENYFVPIDARIARDSDVAAEALRVSDYIRPLAAMKLKASIVVLDAARANPFARSGALLAGGLALIEPEPGVLLAFNSAPGTVAPEGQGPYGPYAQALAEMIREGGLPVTGAFERTRLRVNDMTKGAEVPWHASKIPASLVFFERAADAPPPAISVEQTAAVRARPIRDLDAQDAYIAALERDTLEGYSDFLAVYPNDPMARRVRAIIAARREAITWRRTRVVDTPPAYWSYLRRYPDGPHASDARRRLAFLAAAFEPPPSFAVMAYDLPPPPPEEIVYIRRPVLVFDDPAFGFAPPPPAPVLPGAAPAGIRRVGTAPSAGGDLPAADADLPASSGLGESAAIRGATAEQRHLQQRSQYGRRQQRVEYGHRHEPERTDHDGAAPRAGQRPRAGRTRGSACRGRADRTGAASFSGAEGRHVANAESASCSRATERACSRGQPTSGQAGTTVAQCAAVASAERNPPIIRAIGGSDAGDNSAQQHKAWDIVSAGARDRTGCARRPFRCRGTGNAGPREAGRSPRAADPTCSRGRKIGNTIASSEDESLDSLGGHRARRRLVVANINPSGRPW
jgi:uncharacterized caspase-like protein